MSTGLDNETAGRVDHIGETVPTGRLPVSVVVCAYSMKRWDDLVDAVDSIGRQSRPPLETIVVIDHNDDLLDRATEASRTTAAVVPNRHERGLSGARNTGV